MFDKKQYRQKNKEAISEYNKRYYQEYKEEILKQNKQWKKNNPEYHKGYLKIWAKNNPEKRRIINNRWQNKEYRINLRYKLDKRIKGAIRCSLKNKSKVKFWESLVGYTANELKKHLQKTIPNGYSWQDYLNGELQMDHITPISAFNFDSTNQIDFKKCWKLKNLRLLPAKENRNKSKKLTRPFQPALKII